MSQRISWGAAALLGFLGVSAITCGSFAAGELPVVGNPFADWTLGTLSDNTATTMVATGLFSVIIAWVAMGWMWQVGFSRQLKVFALWLVPTLPAAPVYSQDIYSYLAFGKVVANGDDPYAGSLLDLLPPYSSYLQSIPEIWMDQPSPYGPVHMVTSGLISLLFGSNMLGLIYAYRIVVVLGAIVGIWALKEICSRLGISPCPWMWLLFLNPIFFAHGLFGLHNDVWVAVLMLLAFVFLFRALEGAGTNAGLTYCALFVLTAVVASFIKIIALPVLGIGAIAYYRSLGKKPPWIQFCVPALLCGLVLLIALGLSILCGFSPGWLENSNSATKAIDWKSVPTFISILAYYATLLWSPRDYSRQETLAAVLRHGALIIFVLVTVYLVYQMIKKNRSWMGTLCAVYAALALTLPIIHLWYFFWLFAPVVLWLRNDKWLRILAITAAIICATVSPHEYHLNNAFADPRTWIGMLLALAIGLIIFGANKALTHVRQ
ncbi:MAG: polyprenol phosphomannose-dependent alpha 1,6 mannosyltransferase MptB [Corynebacterium sp.]|nr:polyprenol phosphomannose-dependent alpha 1,6 mannosyltransferase MptB [Corynebacterium sp.]